ncbi:MAG: UDP-N-acetylmuramoyl-L-alanyl-D-glutamate--2,6-diaminopimelate ligase, partial [Sphingorhabdus sp.]|nr:UDP-N-acetylmuramoyl-L-alanyl-D-glutamate--2,6-diaminopimelate ligase [Sphingorhabdus sp.]
MRLGELLPNLASGVNAGGAISGGRGDQVVTGFAIDHRKVAPGTIFGAFVGAKFNGEDYIADAIANGAIAIVASPSAVASAAAVAANGVVLIEAENPRAEFARLAAEFFRPFPEMIAAVTGTNGKTSTVELTRQMWAMAGKAAASIGTLGVTTANDQVTTGLTTPDIVTFLSNLSGLAHEGVTHLAFEASSHGLSQHRSEGCPISIAAFTNLSRDHLDYHGTMEEYFAAKMRLFDTLLEQDGTAVIWADDAWSSRVVEIAQARGVRTITIGENAGDIRLVSRAPTQLGQLLTLEIAGQMHKLALPLIGAYQANNALTAAGIVLASGGKLDEVLANAARLQPVRGRLERAVICRSGAPVYVDYAHTPDALAAAAAAMRPHTAGRLITVFGAGGDRDKGKRPEMGAVAVQTSDIVIVTDDNPRSEDAATIRAEIMAGTGAGGATEIGDRRAAIAHAIGLSQA